MSRFLLECNWLARSITKVDLDLTTKAGIQCKIMGKRSSLVELGACESSLLL